MAGCENYDKAMQSIEKGKKLTGNTEKKVAETKKEAEKSMGKLLGKETAKSDEQEHKGERGEKDKEEEGLGQNRISIFFFWNNRVFQEVFINTFNIRRKHL